MITVKKSRLLSWQISSLYPYLIQDFIDWKMMPDEENYFFGKDAFGINSKVRHVHLVPLDNPSLKDWDANWEKFSERTSDSYLFYVDGGRFGFLLLTIVCPGAHDVWKNDKLLIKTMENMAESFIFNGTVL